MSHPSRASSRRVVVRTSIAASISTGSIVSGPQSVTAAPRVVRACTLERATRLWVMSPMMETFRPSNESTCVRIVSTSSSAWVGWAWAPSPALRMTLSVHRARK